MQNDNKNCPPSLIVLFFFFGFKVSLWVCGMLDFRMYWELLSRLVVLNNIHWSAVNLDEVGLTHAGHLTWSRSLHKLLLGAEMVFLTGGAVVKPNYYAAVCANDNTCIDWSFFYLYSLSYGQ